MKKEGKEGRKEGKLWRGTGGKEEGKRANPSPFRPVQMPCKRWARRPLSSRGGSGGGARRAEGAPWRQGRALQRALGGL